MRRSFPIAGSLVLALYVAGGGCAGGNATTSNGFGDDDGGVGAADATGGDSATDTGVMLGNDAGDSSTTPTDASTDGHTTEGGTVGTCVHTSDCTQPNLCSGDNGLSCVGGFCVPTGHPMSCDDGVACTTDSCDAATNACTHTPDDANCPSAEYCDSTLNCVQQLPCTPGDTTCDRLDTNACAGLWTCDPTHMYCVHGSAPCPDRANAMTMCTMMSTTTTCAWTCNANYADLDGDLEVQPPATSDGCECQSTATATNPDKPELTFTDTNCDGIDGTITNAIFVDTVTGVVGAAGTMAAPVKTIEAGIQLAATQTPVKDVYVSKGIYDETIAMMNGVSIYGGYDASMHWKRSGTNITSIASSSTTAVTASSLPSAIEIQLFQITSADAQGQDASGNGKSSYGVLALNSTNVTVRGCTIHSGAGAVGNTGSIGSTGTPGGMGGTPITVGASSCGAPGGLGGAAVSGAVTGNAGSPGTQAQVTGSGPGGASGVAGAAGACGGASSSNGNAPTAGGGTGFPGNPGANSTTQPANFGDFDSSGNYLPPIGLPGVQSGGPGGGGGGGGSGGGSAHGTLGSACTNCNAIAGGAGGGGGGGGCGGGVGAGGYGGGASFAIVAVSSTVISDTNVLVTATGGAGGAGGPGGPGGGGGMGGGDTGGSSDSDTCSTRSGGAGAAGGPGGTGGTGGAGTGGSGGASVCIAYKGTQPASQTTTCQNGSGGRGGAGGSNGAGTAVSGQQGYSGTSQGS